MPQQTLATQNDPWVVVNYEVDMLDKMCDLLDANNSQYAGFSRHLQNAVVESAVLHARNLVDILLSRSKAPDDIRLADLVPANFQSNTHSSLQAAYGNGSAVNSPCWAFNKKLAHSTKQRTDTFDYSPHLNAVVPLIIKFISEIEPHRPK
jgi:hypothetical protein